MSIVSIVIISIIVLVTSIMWWLVYLTLDLKPDQILVQCNFIFFIKYLNRFSHGAWKFKVIPVYIAYHSQNTFVFKFDYISFCIYQIFLCFKYLKYQHVRKIKNKSIFMESILEDNVINQ